MSLDVWYKSDIQNALSAAERACSAALGAAGSDGDLFVTGYGAGFRSALMTVALAFGLVPTPTQAHQGSERLADGSWQYSSAQEGDAGEPVPPVPLDSHSIPIKWDTWRDVR